MPKIKGWRKNSLGQRRIPNKYREETIAYWGSENVKKKGTVVIPKTVVIVAKEEGSNNGYLVFIKSKDGRKSSTRKYDSRDEAMDAARKWMKNHPNG